MPRALFAATLLVLAACTPTWNWREITIDPVGLRASFPCKPDRADHTTQITPGRELRMHGVGCEAGGATFAVLHADVGSAGELANAMTQWRQASLATTRAQVQGEKPFAPVGALGLQQSALVRASGQRPDGTTLQSASAYFARATSVFQAVVYAPALKPEMTETFFAGLRFE